MELPARQISPVLQLALTEYLVRQQFSGAGDTSMETDAALHLTWHAGRSLSIFVSYKLAKGGGDIRMYDYTEDRL